MDSAVSPSTVERSSSSSRARAIEPEIPDSRSDDKVEQSSQSDATVDPFRASLPPEELASFDSWASSRFSGNPLPKVKPVPEYPPEAELMRLSGYVLAEYTVTAMGTTDNLAVLASSSPIFEQVFFDTVERYRFLPAQSEGRSVPTNYFRTLITFGDVEPEDLPQIDGIFESIHMPLPDEP